MSIQGGLPVYDFNTPSRSEYIVGSSFDLLANDYFGWAANAWDNSGKFVPALVGGTIGAINTFAITPMGIPLPNNLSTGQAVYLRTSFTAQNPIQNQQWTKNGKVWAMLFALDCGSDANGDKAYKPLQADALPSAVFTTYAINGPLKERAVADLCHTFKFTINSDIDSETERLMIGFSGEEQGGGDEVSPVFGSLIRCSWSLFIPSKNV